MCNSSKRKRDASPILRTAKATVNYQHRPLPTPTSIRILELQSGEGTNIIKCRLSVVERDKAPPYEAISYSWGNENDNRVIRCENGKLKVTANLRDALFKIRDPTEVKFLWADAVCINQEDIEERGNQVRQMPLIYANALRVLVWLDLPNSKFDNFDDLFNFEFDTSGASFSGISERANRILHEHVTKLESPNVQAEVLDSETSMIANAFAQLFESPWFTRLWVVQEVGMAKSVVALIGDATLDFVDLIRFILRLERKTILMDRLGLFIAGKANVFTTFPARSRELSGEVDDDWDFLELLEVTRAQKASDPRDYIYALLGHPCALVDDIPISVPDYTSSTQHLFLDVTTTIIRQTGGLRVLSAVHHTNESVLQTPSWVPTWSRDAYVLSLGVYRDRYYDTVYDASAGFSAICNLMGPGTLQVGGFVFDKVDEYFRTEEQEKMEDILVQKGVDQLISAVLQFKTRKTCSHLQNLLEQGQTITAGFRNQKPAHFAAEFAALRLHLIRAAKFEKAMVEDLAPEGTEELERAAQGGGVDEIYWAASRFCLGRKLFSTRDGLLGLGPRALLKGDLCCILFGALVPFTLRPAGDGYQLVGEAHVQGVMKGEAIVDFMLGQKYQEQSFDLI